MVDKRNRLTLTLYSNNKNDKELMEQINHEAETQERSRSQVLKRIAREYYKSRATTGK